MSGKLNAPKASFSVSVELPNRVLLRTVKGEPFYLELTKVPANVLAEVLVGGAKVICNNAFNGGGKDASEDTKLSQMQKRVDSWYKGEYVVVERESAYGAMREAFVDERRAALGCSVADVEKLMRDAVTQAFGEKEKATFSRFLDAVALQIAARDDIPQDEAKAKLEAKYARLAEEAAQRRAQATAKLDLTGITLD